MNREEAERLQENTSLDMFMFSHRSGILGPSMPHIKAWKSKCKQMVYGKKGVAEILARIFSSTNVHIGHIRLGAVSLKFRISLLLSNYTKVGATLPLR